MDVNKIEFIGDYGEVINFEVIEHARLGGENYLLVTEGEDSEDAYVLKEIQDENEELVYYIVEDDDELDAVLSIFNSLLDDIDIK